MLSANQIKHYMQNQDEHSLNCVEYKTPSTETLGRMETPYTGGVIPQEWFAYYLHI